MSKETRKRGRPMLYAKPMKERLVLRLPDDLAKWVKQQAKILKVKPGTAARLLLEAQRNCKKRAVGHFTPA